LTVRYGNPTKQWGENINNIYYLNGSVGIGTIPDGSAALAIDGTSSGIPLIITADGGLSYMQLYIDIAGFAFYYGFGIQFLTDYNSMSLNSAGLAIGTTLFYGNSILEVRDGDIEAGTTGYGFIVRSPNGTRYKITVTNLGILDIQLA